MLKFKQFLAEMGEGVYGENPVPEHVQKKFVELGNLQRDVPERKMIKVTRTMSGGVLSPVLEHTGDLIHRMTHLAPYNNYEYDVKNKLNRVHRALNHPYGFEKEHNENLATNARYFKVPEHEFRARINKELNEYADAHAKLPVYNEAHYHAREASVALGRQNWDKARHHIATLKKMATPTDAAWRAHATKYQTDSDGNLIEYKHG